MKLSVIGLGYIGLPTAVMFAKHGLTVHGVDVNREVVQKLSSGLIHIEEPGLQEMLDEVLKNGNLSFGLIPEEADAFIISVPTPIRADKSSNLDYVVEATKSITPFIKNKDLIILESTVPPRTIEDIVLPILKASRPDIYEDLLVSHSPERVLPGKLLEELVQNDRIVGGINSESSSKTADLYKSFVKGNIHITDATTAEMVKLMENTYRDVNIAFANEMAKVAEQVGFNVWEAIDLANCHPRVNIHRPGPGVGGHCIAVDPWFIYESAPTLAKLVHTSRTINDGMPEFVVNKVKELVQVGKDKTVAVLGLAFKGNIDDMRESPAVEIVELLRDYYNVQIYDPHVKESIRGKKDTLEDAVTDAELILVLTDHKEFKEIDPINVGQFMRKRILLDTRNIVNTQNWASAGFQYCLVGQQMKAVNSAGTKFNEGGFYETVR